MPAKAVSQFSLHIVEPLVDLADAMPDAVVPIRNGTFYICGLIIFLAIDL